MDLGATHHVYNYLQVFRETRRFKGEEFTLKVRDGRRFCATIMGELSLHFDILWVLENRDCYYVKKK